MDITNPSKNNQLSNRQFTLLTAHEQRFQISANGYVCMQEVLFYHSCASQGKKGQGLRAKSQLCTSMHTYHYTNLFWRDFTTASFSTKNPNLAPSQFHHLRNSGEGVSLIHIQSRPRYFLEINANHVRSWNYCWNMATSIKCNITFSCPCPQWIS